MTEDNSPRGPTGSMRELLAPHWLLGGGLAIGGAAAYRFGDRLLSGGALTAAQLAGLAGIAVGLFVIARGVSRRAAARGDGGQGGGQGDSGQGPDAGA